MLAQLGVQCDVASEKGLKPGADVAEYGARSHHDPADDTQILNDAIAIELEIGGYE